MKSMVFSVLALMLCSFHPLQGVDPFKPGPVTRDQCQHYGAGPSVDFQASGDVHTLMLDLPLLTVTPPPSGGLPGMVLFSIPKGTPPVTVLDSKSNFLLRLDHPWLNAAALSGRKVMCFLQEPHLGSDRVYQCNVFDASPFVVLIQKVCLPQQI